VGQQALTTHGKAKRVKTASNSHYDQVMSVTKGLHHPDTSAGTRTREGFIASQDEARSAWGALIHVSVVCGIDNYYTITSPGSWMSQMLRCEIQYLHW